jgi:hypothetical protein
MSANDVLSRTKSVHIYLEFDVWSKLKKKLIDRDMRLQVWARQAFLEKLEKEAKEEPSRV